MAKAIRIHQTGGPEVLKWEDVDVPAPKEGEARIRHTAVGLNYIDTYHRGGLYPSFMMLASVAAHERHAGRQRHGAHPQADKTIGHVGWKLGTSRSLDRGGTKRRAHTDLQHATSRSRRFGSEAAPKAALRSSPVPSPTSARPPANEA